jgi:hypothetical protein
MLLISSQEFTIGTIADNHKIIIFDDLERCKLKISELFGYINEFVEHYGCKVILLSEEIKIFEKM